MDGLIVEYPTGEIDFWWELTPPPPELTPLARIRWSASQNYYRTSEGNVGVTDDSNRHHSCNAADVLAINNDDTHPLYPFISRCVTPEHKALIISAAPILYVNVILERPYLQPFIKTNLAVEPDEVPANTARHIATSLEPAIAQMLSVHGSLSLSTLGTARLEALSPTPITYTPATTNQNQSRTSRLLTWLSETEKQAKKLSAPVAACPVDCSILWCADVTSPDCLITPVHLSL